MTYHAGSRELQDRFDTRRLADRLVEVKVRDTISADDRAFIEASDMLFLATADAEGRPQCSYKGGAPGFVHVIDERTIAFPSYDGNGMYLSAGNVSVNHHVGLLFISFEARRRLRLNGIASQSDDDPLRGEWPEARARTSPRYFAPWRCPSRAGTAGGTSTAARDELVTYRAPSSARALPSGTRNLDGAPDRCPLTAACR
jgi:predicted pyridoxine 5'-phosphate oxidase superfamily flavin-nucleotide-binding protein